MSDAVDIVRDTLAANEKALWEQHPFVCDYCQRGDHQLHGEKRFDLTAAKKLSKTACRSRFSTYVTNDTLWCQCTTSGSPIRRADR